MNAIFKALSDETRREILELLRKRDMSAGEIADVFQISKPSISHHLDLLKRADLVTSEKKGQFILYSLNTTIVDDILKKIIYGKVQERNSLFSCQPASFCVPGLHLAVASAERSDALECFRGN